LFLGWFFSLVLFCGWGKRGGMVFVYPGAFLWCLAMLWGCFLERGLDWWDDFSAILFLVGHTDQSWASSAFFFSVK
jgi:hypothetical protein